MSKQKRVPKDIKMDVVYVTPPEDFWEEFEEEGEERDIVVKDARDEAHPHRIRVFYTPEREQEYFTILQKFGIEDKSYNFLRAESLKRS